MQIPIVKNVPLQTNLETDRKSLDYRIELVKEAFSDELWLAMENRGLNQVQFASKAEVSKQFLTRVFRGSNCTIETMVKLSEALGYHLNLHLTPEEYQCDWLHYMAKEPETNVRPYAQLWSKNDYSEIHSEDSELKHETVPAAA